jgi:hypothetical protein
MTTRQSAWYYQSPRNSLFKQKMAASAATAKDYKQKLRDEVRKGLSLVTHLNHLSSSAVFSLFAAGNKFIPPTNDNYFLRATLPVPRTYLGPRESPDMNWVNSLDNLFVVVSIPRDKSELTVQIVARDLPSAAHNYAFRRYINQEADDSQQFNSGIVGSSNVLGSVKLHWNRRVTSMAPSFVLQEVYSSSVLASIKFPHPLLYMTLDTNYAQPTHSYKQQDSHFAAMVRVFGLNIAPDPFQQEGHEAAKFMIGLACLMAIVNYTPTNFNKDATVIEAPSLQFSTANLKQIGFRGIDDLVVGGQAQTQIPTLRMVRFMRKYYGLFGPEGQDAVNTREIYLVLDDEKRRDRQRRDSDHEMTKKNNRPGGGGAGGAAGVAQKVPLPLPTDEDIEFLEQMNREYYKRTKSRPEPTPDVYGVDPEVVKKELLIKNGNKNPNLMNELTPATIRDIIQQLDVENSKQRVADADASQALLLQLLQ